MLTVDLARYSGNAPKTVKTLLGNQKLVGPHLMHFFRIALAVLLTPFPKLHAPGRRPQSRSPRLGVSLVRRRT